MLEPAPVLLVSCPLSCIFGHTYLDFDWEKQSVLFVEDMLLCLTEC